MVTVATTAPAGSARGVNRKEISDLQSMVDGAKAEVQSLIQPVADHHGRGIELISTELEDVVEGSTQVVVLSRGTVVGELDRDEIDEHRIMELMAAGPRPSSPPKHDHRNRRTTWRSRVREVLSALKRSEEPPSMRAPVVETLRVAQACIRSFEEWRQVSGR